MNNTSNAKSYRTKKFVNDVVLHPSQGNYWAIRFQVGRFEYALMYVALPLIIFALFVVAPLYIFSPEIFSAVDYGNMTQSARNNLWVKLPIAIMIVCIPFLISVSMAIVGQIKRFKAIGLSPWFTVLNLIPFAIFAIAFMLCVIPSKKQ